MNRWLKSAIVLAAVVALCLTGPNANAQEWSKDQMGLWQTVQKAWELSMADDLEDFYATIHDDYLGWGNSSKYPGDKAMVEKWYGYYAPKYKTVLYELFPLGIVVSGDVGVAHYYYDVTMKDEEGKEIQRSGRWTDVFKKEKGKWYLISDHGGAEEDDD